MRGHLQQERGQLVGRLDLLIGWLLALGATAVYLLCLEPSTSFWDAGEFISVSALLQVGHPPGAPLYQLLAHVFTLFAGSNMLAVAPWCNALSALSAGLTVMFLYWTILLLFQPQPQRPLMARHRVAALVGSLCYLFCDTAWFSAVESEVYSLAMLIASAALWAMLHWYRCPEDRDWLRRYRARSAVLGKNILILSPGREPESARALALDDACGLVVLTEAGERKTLTAGEVSIRPGTPSGRG